jgi:CHRD domain
LRPSLPLLVAALAAITFGAGAAAPTIADFRLGATLDWRQQVPKPAHLVRVATGSLTGDLDHQKREVGWKLAYRNLSGRPTAAHLHLGKPARTGPPVLSLCGPKAPRARPCKSDLRGTVVVSAAVVRSLEAGNTYVDLHTRRNPKGEIRGQVATLR